jgi:hypothetical protein
MRYFLLLLIAVPLPAWNETGHKIVAYVAYQNLTKPVRARVDALLKEHLHFGKWKQQPFLEAAYWPDAIRRTEHDRPAWHYINLPFSPDHTPFPAPDSTAPSVLTKIQEFRRTVGDPTIPASERAIQLAWLLHLVGDVHQPLHTVARFTKTLPKGDRGGNGVYVIGSSNLHSYWDGLLGDTPTGAFIRKSAESLMKEHPLEKPANLNPRQWVEDGAQVAQKSVYTFGSGNGSKQNPIALPDAYRVTARQIGRRRAALAGYRLAALLNEAFAK